MDFQARKSAILQAYIAMASLPWAKAQAWHSVNELATKHPREFADLPELLTAEMKRRAADGQPAR